MTHIRVDTIVNKDSNGAPILGLGASISPGYALTCAGGMSISGILTATSFSGDGSGLNNLPTVTPSKAIALKNILVFDEYKS